MSTDHQSLDQQRDALTAAGAERIYTDQLSGTRDDRPGLNQLLDYARSGDVVIVTSLDRLGRCRAGSSAPSKPCTRPGCCCAHCAEGIDYSTATGRMLAGIFAALAAYERDLMHERAAAARAAARARGRHTGRPAKLSSDQTRQVRALRAGGESIAELVRGFGVSRATSYRALDPDPSQQPHS